MSNTTTNRPEGFTKSTWENATYTAYKGLIDILHHKTGVSQYLRANKALFEACGIPVEQYYVLSLVISMTKDCTQDHVAVRKVNPVAYLRKYFNGGWKERAAREVVYTAPKAPTASTSKKGKEPTKAELQAQLKAAMDKLAQLTMTKAA